MPPGSMTEIAGRCLRVTHLDKVVYPATGTTKAEVMDYYVQIAPFLLPHMDGRIVTRKRWVDGVGTPDQPGSVFFEKNLPGSAPDWLRRVDIAHRHHITTYPVFEDPAALAWAAQMGALELHVPQWRVDAKGEPRAPDRFVLDLDPGPGVGLAECVTVATSARRLLEDIGLSVFPVTSGSKGLHLYAGLDSSHNGEQINVFAQELAHALGEELPDLVVTSMRKADRSERVFVDWSQNNPNKTTITPYSLRGTEEPFVAAPRTWSELNDPELKHLRLHDVLERLRGEGDPMQALGRQANVTDRLAVYRSKRDADRTPEPVPSAHGSPAADAPTTRIFVIQEHHARRLHWDFRLEHEGVLRSWAVPKGIPTDPKHNHLAVPTEDHPLDYAEFEGTIPPGEYGAGAVTIWDAGTYEVGKWSQNEIIVTLTGRTDGGLGTPTRLALIRTDTTWLLHLMSPANPERPPRHTFVPPMLATPGSPSDITHDDDWAFEMKWDGIRAIAVINPSQITLFSRSGADMSSTYPEVIAALQSWGENTTAVIDGEIVAIGPSGAPDFSLLQQRMGLADRHRVERARVAVPVQYFVFDVLAVESHDCQAEPYSQRRRILNDLDLDDGTVVRVPAARDGDVAAAVDQSRQWNLEGIVAKKRKSRYRPERRSRAWIKIKQERMQSVVIGGWRHGQGTRVATFGSLLLGVPEAEGLTYVGRVGSGFDERSLATLTDHLEPLEQAASAFVDVPDDVAEDAVWVQPLLVGEVAFSEWTAAGRLRQPRWRGLRDDIAASDVQRE